MFRCFLIAAAILASLPLNAQMRGAGFAFAGRAHVPTGGNFTLRSFPGRAERPFARPPYFFAGPYFYSDYGFDETSQQPAEPEIVVMQAPPAARVVEKTSAEPLLLELRGGRFVKVGAGDAEDAGAQNSQSRQSTPVAQTPRQLPPTVLVFHDGHEEEVTGYTIAGSILYADANYWTQGSWTRKIQIADLDVPATLKLNQERGTNFALPSAPNEIMVRP